MPADRIQRLERLLEIARDLNLIAEWEPYLQNLVSAAVELTDSETASILEYDRATNDLTFLAVPWFHRELLREIVVPLDGSVAGWVVREGCPLVIPDVSKDPRDFNAVDRISNYQTRSLLAVPVFFRGQVVGVFEALNKSDDHYSDEDVAVLESLAAYAGLAIQANNLERRLQTSYNELAELDRLKNDFIAITSHELRTPLGLILGHATFLRELIGAQYREQLDTIIRSATRLKEIVESLSNVENYQAGLARIRQRKISIVSLIQEVVASFEEMARQRGISLTVSVEGQAGKAGASPQDLLVEADGHKISIALSNLVRNALTFTDAGGHVSITAGAIPGYVKVSVIDDGVGIPAKDLPRIFERFFQVESHLTRRHGGMGLGLSVAKAMIEMHGGRIWAESIEGKGSNFTFLLPIDPEQASAAESMFVP
ncbi:MAG: ATP-binding protein [Anaerolineae bacterium]